MTGAHSSTSPIQEIEAMPIHDWTRVTAEIELVSPGNMSSRHALRSFVDKAIELLNAGIHLLIVDLFPPGPRQPQSIHAAVSSEIIEDNFQLPPDQPLTLVAYSAGIV